MDNNKYYPPTGDGNLHAHIGLVVFYGSCILLVLIALSKIAENGF